MEFIWKRWDKTRGEDERERAVVKQNGAVWVGDLFLVFPPGFPAAPKEALRGYAWQQTSATDITWLHLSVRCLHSNGGGLRVDQRGRPVCGGGRGRLQTEPVWSDGAECGLWCGAVQHRSVTTATIDFNIIYIVKNTSFLANNLKDPCVCHHVGVVIFHKPNPLSNQIMF